MILNNINRYNYTQYNALGLMTLSITILSVRTLHNDTHLTTIGIMILSITLSAK
jgi:hypothetical protein